ncbi:MAG: DUF2851 family protein [Bacteroidota bacterium]|nr:DUF2851 family protein [Bacteroidota bacterium]
MTEKLLQFIWKHRHFNQQGLTLSSGESLSIGYPGDENHNQGPDFIHARIRINDTYWAGSIELHLLSSGWDKHGHDQDENYRNVILHVVWKHDQTDMARNIPQLELCQRVSGIMLDTYSGWMHQYTFVPCEKSLQKPAPDVWKSWQAVLLTKRLDRKMVPIAQSLQRNHYHWEVQLWWMIAGNFGLKVNAPAFETIARSIPFTLLAKHRAQPIQLEALLFGQANLLERNFSEAYPLTLKKEFHFLKTKYGLRKVFDQVHFLRMRPDNFPTIRLSQLASLYTESTNLFAWILQCDSLSELRKKFALSTSDYWFNHYVFDKESPHRVKVMGRGTAETIIVNGVIPLLYSYGKTHPDKSITQKAIYWMQEMPAEQNRIIYQWKGLGIEVKSAAGSQALLELKTEFCQQKKCLECDIGKHLLKSSGKNIPAAENH